MAWTTPDTRSAGDVLSAASYNTYLRDNLNYLHSGRPLVAIVRNNGGDYTISVGSGWQDVDSTYLAAVFTTTTGRVLMAFSATLYASGGTGQVELALDIDGTHHVAHKALLQVGDTRVVALFAGKDGLSIGSHTVKVRWQMTANTARMFSDAGSQVALTVWEV